MAIPINNVSFEDLRTEFNASKPISLSQYYSSVGGMVPYPPPPGKEQTGPIPTYGNPISLGNFRGVTKLSDLRIIPPAQVDMVDHANGPFTYEPIFLAAKGKSATNILFILTAAGGLPEVDPTATYSWSWELVPGYTSYYSQTGIYEPNYFTNTTLAQSPTPNNSVKGFFIGAANSGLSVYRVTLTDGYTTTSLDLGFDAWW